jgi:signal transduction histidine kinase
MHLERLNPYSIPPFISAVLFASLASYVYLQNRTSRKNQFFSIWCLLTFHWQVAWSLLFNVGDEQTALLIARIGYSGIVFLPIFLFHFLSELFDRTIRERAWIIGGYVFTFVSLLSIWTGNWFIQGVYRYTWGYYPKAGLPLHPLFLVAVGLFFVKCLLVTLRELRDPENSQVRKSQASYLLAATFSYFFAASDFLVNYGFRFYPLGIVPITGSFLLIAYSIGRHRLMGISIFARRAALVVTTYVVLTSLVVPIIYVLYRGYLFSPSRLSFFSVLAGTITAGAILSLAPVLYAYLIRRKTYFHESHIAGLTHELKAPILAIESALDLISDGKSKKRLDSRDDAYFNMVERNLGRLRHHVEELLHTFANEDAALDLQQTDLNLVCEELIAALTPLATAKGVVIKFQTDHPSAVFVADRKKIEIAISNLIANAVKFTDRGKIVVTVERTRSAYRIVVQDSGIGITGDELPLIFDRFFQGVRGSRKGSGIGLSVSKALIEAHGGTIEAVSEGRGKGSTFSVVFPSHDAAENWDQSIKGPLP